MGSCRQHLNASFQSATLNPTADCHIIFAVVYFGIWVTHTHAHATLPPQNQKIDTRLNWRGCSKKERNRVRGEELKTAHNRRTIILAVNARLPSSSGYLGYTSGLSLSCMVFFLGVVSLQHRHKKNNKMLCSRFVVSVHVIAHH